MTVVERWSRADFAEFALREPRMWRRRAICTPAIPWSESKVMYPLNCSGMPGEQTALGSSAIEAVPVAAPSWSHNASRTRLENLVGFARWIWNCSRARP